MISRLFIRNIAVIENAEIEFGEGFNILTGETGAGKSIVIDSLNMLKGERTGKDIIRSGEQKARVDGVFNVDEATAQILNDQFGIESDGGEILISREISIDGKNNIRVNGMPVIGSVLKEIGEYLVTIHGQHDNTSLLSRKNHLPLLDSVSGGKVDEVLQKYREVHDLINKKQTELESLQTDEQEKSRRLDMLAFQIDEIEAASLTVGEDEELSQRRTFLENSEKIATGSRRAYALLYEGDDMQKSANDILWDGINSIDDISAYDGELKKIYDEISDLGYELSDKIRALGKYIDGLSYDPMELEEVDDRLDLIHNLKRKYGATIELIGEYLKEAKAEADGIVHADEYSLKLREEIDALTIERAKLSDKLTALRTEAGKTLSSEIEKQLADLDMAKVRFRVKIEESGFTSKGKDDVEFLICTNVGEDFKPLAKIASGGELSRIMLGIKSVLTSDDTGKTLIFDEIDAGVSGHAAQKIGEKLRAISTGSQIICITHLPQIAALAKDHYLIEKKVENDRTVTTVEHLDFEQRKYELARTLGGAAVTDITLANASELLKQAGN